MKYFYDGVNGRTKDRFYHRQVEKSPLFRIGENFEKYDFTAPAKPFKQSVIDRLEQLRDTGKYLRFWFSGGKDSRLILDTSRDLGMEFDEIVIIKNQLLGPEYQLGAITEILNNAVDYIKTIKHQFKKTKITIKDFQAEEYELVFQNQDWYKHTTCWYIHSAIEPNLLYRYVNPAKKLLEEITDRIDIMGSIHPHVYWDNGWKFVFVDFQFPQNLWHTCDNFLTSPDHPEVLHSYVKSLIEQFEKKDLKPYRFQENLFVSTNQKMRNIRELLPEYQFDIYRPEDRKSVV